MPLKNLGNFWRSLEVPLINCKIQLKLRRIKYCILFEAASGNDSVNSVNVFFFSIRHIKLCIPDITLSAKDNQKLSKLPSK